MIAMITTCPACRTAFRINNEQLAARDGRVRCGRCTTVFDAREALRTEPADSAPENSGPRDDLPEQAGAPAFQAMDPIPAAAAVSPDAADTVDPLSETAPAADTPVTAAELLATPAPTTGESDSLFPVTEPPRARHRVVWTAGSTVLALALMAQIAFHYRGEIAYVFPEIRPALAEMCASLDCGVPLPRRAEMISIESSDLQGDAANPNVMVLTATLRNRAAFAQSLPSLELTLTDAQDLPLARRVLGVHDYLGPGVNIQAGFTGNSELSIKVYIEASSLKATGYRLYLFFP